MGDSNSYLLTTAENELGVVIAKSEAGLCDFSSFPLFITKVAGIDSDI